MSCYGNKYHARVFFIYVLLYIYNIGKGLAWAMKFQASIRGLGIGSIKLLDNGEEIIFF